MEDWVLMKGNEALAEAAVQAGCRHYFGYPITPQTEITAYMASRLPEIGGTFVQAESEIAAINMVLGASAAGVRAMTSSSSPGISLKAEGISYMVGSDLPCVIVNIQRGGPGLGGIQPSQADYNQATKALGHGDMHVLVYAPSTVQEIADTVTKAFDKADEYRMPAMILGDGLLGQMMEPVRFPKKDAAAIEKPWACNGHKNARRRNIINSLYLVPEELEQKIMERERRYEHIRQNETMAESYLTNDADVLLVAYGAAARVARSAVNTARGMGIRAGLLRPVTLWPFPDKEIVKAASPAGHILVVEMSTGQMVHDVRLAVQHKKPVQLLSHSGGVVPTPGEVTAKIKAIAGGCCE